MTDFDALYAAHRDDVWRYFKRRSPADHEDLVTEVFLVAWRRAGEVPHEPLPWLYGVARRVLANHRRAGDRRDALAERAAAHAAPAAPDLAEAVGLRTDLARALAELSDQDRELVLLVAWEGLTLAEAAAALGCRRGTAAVRLHRARRRLHTALHDDESGPALASMTALEER
ncbi:sigma-70 family RNA polymerase sigma factor [Solirubrobacter sp. CPCC 204708]|uniref:Sigma-70 family RNA polymerase sigma factor n=1 Tax=Solirubrobacter deserti TaxID=2282478 RepID=A0ABT4RUR7_9ACTN|nr:sigma-70 family RNA polymerase sigma factor [Solirubrobacter deserti]MBE2317921.1 sigma-70 family RNA polymerase sigma factor [Solirubrobacter deserti]MDA0142291.1 sigma-70 family RNA polymerase sigma factor [Solirubrobacter deserti]